MFFIIVLAITVLLNLATFYTGVIGLFTLKRRRRYPAAAPVTRFAVIIPARNEARVVGKLVQRLKQQDYPADMIDVYVAVNNSTDDTEAVARAAGAQIIRSTGEIRCKGDVLHQAFDQLMDKGYDAYAVFDADNIPDPAFMQRMNDALQGGERVCKGRLKSGNAFESWVSGGYGLYHALMEYFFSRPHTNAGFSSNLVGTAFVAHHEVMAALGGWNTVTLCEDTEFAAQCSRIGYRVAFIYDALSYDEQVSSFGLSLKQRHRWCYGMVQCARTMIGSMFSRRCPKKGMARDFGMTFVLSHTAPLAMLFMLAMLPFQPAPMLWLTLAGTLLSIPAMMLLGVALCLLGGYPIRKMIPSILMFPLFLFSFAPLQLLAVFVPVRSWEPIPHTGQEDTDALG